MIWRRIRTWVRSWVLPIKHEIAAVRGVGASEKWSWFRVAFLFGKKCGTRCCAGEACGRPGLHPPRVKPDPELVC